MTQIQPNTKLRRVTGQSVRELRRDRPLVVGLHEFHMTLRPQGMKKGYDLTYRQAYIKAAELEAGRQRAERLARRKAGGAKRNPL